jgi:hypothetical protein
MLREIALDLVRNDLSGNIGSRRRGLGQAEGRTDLRHQAAGILLGGRGVERPKCIQVVYRREDAAILYGNTDRIGRGHKAIQQGGTDVRNVIFPT